MKFARRRAPRATLEIPAADAPRGRPEAVTAVVLDGHLLVVAVAARAGSLGLRRAGAGAAEQLSLTGETDSSQAGYLATRLDLETPARPTPSGRWDVVWLPPGGGDAVAVWTPPLAPQVLRPSPDGAHRHALVRGADGGLGLKTTPLPPTVACLAISADAERATLRLAGAGERLVLLDESDQEVASVPATAAPDAPDESLVVLTAAQLEHAPTGPTRALLVTSDGDRRPVGRRANELDEVARGAPLPELLDPATGAPRLRLRWLRLPDRGQPTLRVVVLDDRAGPR